MRLSRSIGLGLLVAATLAPGSFAEDMHLRYITLYAGGWYNVDPIMLHWKTPEGETVSSKNQWYTPDTTIKGNSTYCAE